MRNLLLWLSLTLVLVGCGQKDNVAQLPETRETPELPGPPGIVADVDSAFSDQQAALIHAAVEVVNKRLFAPEVTLNLDEIRDSWKVDVDADVWKAINELPKQERVAQHQIDLLEKQLAELSKQRFVVKIDHFHKDSDLWGEAEIGTVMCSRDESGNSVLSGHFEISLNGFHLEASDEWQDKDVYVWAVVIAHEMLHNLGHVHGDRKELKQMIAFERCFYYDGDYKSQGGCPIYQCGVKEAHAKK